MYNEVITRGSNQFDRIQYNEAKSGYYPTLQSCCEDLSSLFLFEGTQRILEPSAGEGSAVLTTCKKETGDNKQLFAVELNSERASLCEESKMFECVLNADFLSETYITNSAFSFIFANPPYGEESGLDSGKSSKQRLEKRFLDACKKYLSEDGVICWIIPSYIFMEDSFCTSWMYAFDTLGVYKFPEPEYSRFKQVAVIGKKRTTSKGILKEQREEFQKKWAIDTLSWLTGNEERIVVPSAPEIGKFQFRKMQLDIDKVLIYESNHKDEDTSLKAAIFSKTKGKVMNGARVYNPPRRVSKQNLALLTACGVGSGFAGSKEERNLHLQRGSVERVSEYTVSTDAKSGNKVMTEKVSAKTQIILVEQTGEITNLCRGESAET